MASGVTPARKRDGSLYYRVSLTYRRKHISLGSFPTELEGYTAFREGKEILSNPELSLPDYCFEDAILSLEKIVVLFNFRDNGIYLKTPIYLRESYFEYWYSIDFIYKFDIDDLFYFSGHKLQKRGGHLFVADYGSQISGIRSYAVLGRDFMFVNGDNTDFRMSNIQIINAYYGVEKLHSLSPKYRTRIHINGNYLIGTFDTPEEAAIAYNKACDAAHDAGLIKNFPQNYIEHLSPREYAKIYSRIVLPKKYRAYLSSLETPSVP